MSNPSDVPPLIREKFAALGPPEPMRRGSVSERYMRCNKPGCRCAEGGKARHGPYFSLTRAVAGQTRSRLLTAEQASLARAQVQAGHRFRMHLEEYWQACERWADAQLEAPEAASQEVAKKGGSKKPSSRKLSPRSMRS